MWRTLYITTMSTVFLGVAFGQDFVRTCEQHESGRICRAIVAGMPSGIGPGKAQTVVASPDSTFARVRRSPVLNIREMLSLETDLLSYHIFNELLPAATLRAGFGRTMISNNTDANLNGSRQVVISRPSPSGSSPCNNETIKLFSGLGDKVTIVEEDIPFDYGLIHIIDRPLTLPRLVSESLVRIGQTDFVHELQQAGLIDEVDKTPNVTCFAPTNQALASITQFDNLTPAQRLTLLSNHVVFGTTAYSPDLIDGASLTTTAGTNITVSRRGGDLFVDGARVLRSDVITINGVCHVIDQVLGIPLPIPDRPSSLSSTPPSTKTPSSTSTPPTKTSSSTSTPPTKTSSSTSTPPTKTSSSTSTPPTKSPPSTSTSTPPTKTPPSTSTSTPPTKTPSTSTSTPPTSTPPSTSTSTPPSTKTPSTSTPPTNTPPLTSTPLTTKTPSSTSTSTPPSTSTPLTTKTPSSTSTSTPLTKTPPSTSTPLTTKTLSSSSTNTPTKTPPSTSTPLTTKTLSSSSNNTPTKTPPLTSTPLTTKTPSTSTSTPPSTSTSTPPSTKTPPSASTPLTKTPPSTSTPSTKTPSSTSTPPSTKPASSTTCTDSTPITSSSSQTPGSPLWTKSSVHPVPISSPENTLYTSESTMFDPLSSTTSLSNNKPSPPYTVTQASSSTPPFSHLAPDVVAPSPTSTLPCTTSTYSTIEQKSHSSVPPVVPSTTSDEMHGKHGFVTAGYPTTLIPVVRA